jgi:ABC-2 type transport system ATP-binding protein
MSELAIDVRGAVKRFGTIKALDRATFMVRRGELMGLLGPNGAGKTTMIKAIAGRVALDEGEVRLSGRLVAARETRPQLGVVPQEMGVYPLLTARENLEVFGRLHDVRGAALAERVNWALSWSDLAERAREPVKRFSGGMKRRLNIACSLLHRPSLVLLDEPTVGVDPQSRERIYEMLAGLRGDGVTIVLTTHHLEEAEQRCERVVIIDRGSIVADGTVAELVAATLGAGRDLRVDLARPLGSGFALPPNATVSADRRMVTIPIARVTHDVPAALAAISAAGAEVSDVSMAGRSLQDVFIALTGRELRE